MTIETDVTMIAGYMLSGHDNNSYMLGEETRPAASPEEWEFFDWRFVFNGGQHPATCPKCGRKTDSQYVDPKFKLRKKKMDISSTYDGYTIVSTRFRDFCSRRKLIGLEFVDLPSQPDHFWFRVQKSLEIDRDASEDLRFMNYCRKCRTHAGVFGTCGLRFVGVDSVIPKGIYRTDLEFAQAHEQSPIIVVDTDLGELMKSEKFKGASFRKIEF